MKCEDYPCCGHGPTPYGDGGGCPDAQGRFNCVGCGQKLVKGAPSALCISCRQPRRGFEMDMTGQDEAIWGENYD